MNPEGNKNEEVIIYRAREAGEANDTRIVILGLAGSLGSRLTACLSKVPGLHIAGGFDTSLKNDRMRGPVLGALAGLHRERTPAARFGSEEAQSQFGGADLIIDARKRALKMDELLRSLNKPTIAQSVGSEYGDENEASRFVPPTSTEYSDFMRVGDCNTTALSTVLGALEGRYEKADVAITMVANPESHIYKYAGDAGGGIVVVPTEKMQALCDELFDGKQGKVNIRSIHQVSGISCYVHQIDLTLNPNNNIDDLRYALQIMPHLLVYPDASQEQDAPFSTFAIHHRSDLIETAELQSPPVVVFQIKKTGANECRIMVGVINKRIATGANLDAVGYIQKRTKQSPGDQIDINGIMIQTDAVMGWDKTRRLFHRQ